MRAESGSELRIAGETVIDSARVTSTHAVPGRIALCKGWHSIRLRFLEYGFNNGLTLRWEGPGQTLSQLAGARLGHIP